MRTPKGFSGGSADWSAGTRLEIRRLDSKKGRLRRLFRCEELTNFLTNMAGEVAHRFGHPEQRSTVCG